MSRTGVGCRVLIDGRELDDGCIDWGNIDPADLPGYVGQGVSATSGLSVAWGRSTTVDQPVASACTFKIVDDPGGITVLQSIAIGARVDVYADANISGGDGASVFTDPTFSTELRTTPRNARAVRTQTRADDPAGWSAGLSAIDSAALATVQFPPGPLQPDGTNPAAWAALRATNPGETWTIRIRVYAPSGMVVRLRPVLYSGPYASAATVAAQTVTTATHDAWTTVAVTFSPGATAQWVGFQVELSGGVTWESVGGVPTWGTTDAAQTWQDLGMVYVDTVAIIPPAGGVGTTVQVFNGRITDLEGYFDSEWDGPGINVTASDFLADLGNRYIGDVPWVVEPVSARVVKILSLAAIPGEAAVSIDIASTLAAIPLTAMDIDSRAAVGLLTDIAQSVDGVLWSATHPVIGPFMRLEDPAQRIALYKLALTGSTITIIPIDFSVIENPPPALSACDILRDPVNFKMSVSDIATRVDATYQEQPTPPATDTVERHVKLVRSAIEEQYGTRAISIQTDLTTTADVSRVADQLISRLNGAWRIEGVVFADADVTTPDAAAARSLVTLLNAVTRGGQALLLTDLDEWSPVGASAPIYLEGGKYSFIDGGWSLSLNVSRASGFGQSTRWDELPNDPAWKWDAWDTSVTWDDLRGVAKP